ncbi:MAG: indolepyruvate ferredoxin oxidoreductase subunit alpha [Pelotomaculum sp.]|uniref:Indolepyruvate oxidoreductase subunit IorA n=1 Tax=Pelotomaculum thermopropionicum (strain DSM 13744 / JCM 10971 / SI) TaxID=370438 RepID=A5CYA3_PELTS|nr:indolepyruvate ferredoxin oxidoreductase subunit alpha [Pelotomaculum sp.]BAF61027.1 indolepyruvate ferredoxin oxidoreductase, alpha and beta subunits [Pelotomaculum thermopropionicum SI]
MKELLSGNEAIARGAYESGVTVAAAYPGTPSTEILENLARYPGVYAEWAPNEKVAVEVGIGASLAGARTLVAMKHVGVNVAADPLLTFAYTGVNGGFVLVSADDPGIHSSQNEQDNRRYAYFAKIPLLEPGDSQEAKEMVGLALDISEKFDIPVMLRTTTRVSHSQGLVEIGEPKPRSLKPYARDARKYLMVPAYARLRRVALEERLARLKEYSENSPLNFIEWRGRAVGVITSGVSYQYVREVLPGASVLKLGMTNPLPENLIKKFAGEVEKLIVVEELEPYLEEQVRAMGFKVSGKDIVPYTGELDPGVLTRVFTEAGILEPSAAPAAALPEGPAAPGRPPVMCPGCPHRGLFYALRGLKLTVTGDIGCYTLGGLPPLEALDCCICMGASIGAAHGAGKADPALAGRTVAVIGDSTFLHSGLTGLLNVVYNRGSSTVIILDNGTTAMTGHQDHPGTGRTLMGEPAPAVDLEALVRALGVRRVRVVDPLNLAETRAAVEEEVAAGEPSVIISRRPCVLLKKETRPAAVVLAEKCRGCKVCLRLGCPAISMKDGRAAVDPIACTGCELCVQVCREGALLKGVEACD